MANKIYTTTISTQPRDGHLQLARMQLTVIHQGRPHRIRTVRMCVPFFSRPALLYARYFMK